MLNKFRNYIDPLNQTKRWTEVAFLRGLDVEVIEQKLGHHQLSLMTHAGFTKEGNLEVPSMIRLGRIATKGPFDDRWLVEIHISVLIETGSGSNPLGRYLKRWVLSNMVEEEPYKNRIRFFRREGYPLFADLRGGEIPGMRAEDFESKYSDWIEDQGGWQECATKYSSRFG